MCSTRPSYDRNDTIPLRQAQAFSNRENSVLPTPRGRIDRQIMMNPIRILKDSAFANELIPNRTGT